MATYDDKLRTLEVLRDSDAMIVTGFGEALMGYCDFRGNLVASYDIDKCIDIIAQDMPYEDAIEYFYFNIHGAYVGESSPIFIRLDHNI